MQQELGAWIPSNMGLCPSLRHSEEKHMGEMILSNEQLVLRVQCGEDVADNMLQLWKQTKGFICKYAKKYSNYAEMEELEQEGYIALCNAIDGFKTEEGNSFIGYLSFYLKTQFARCINNNRAIPIPSHAGEKHYKYMKLYAMFYQEYGRKPTDKEMQSFLGVKDETYQSIKQSVYTENMNSLSSPVGNGDDELALEDTVASEKCFEDDVERAIDYEAMKEDLWEAVNSLESKERNIIHMKYKEGMTQAQIGEVIGCSGSYVSVLERKTLKSLGNNKSKYREYYVDYLGGCYHGVGVAKFNRTWTSTTEHEAIKRVDQEAYWKVKRKEEWGKMRNELEDRRKAYEETKDMIDKELLTSSVEVAEVLGFSDLVEEYKVS